MKVAIWGKGVHCKRYADAFLFYKEDVEIIYVEKSDVGREDADVLVLSEPFLLKDLKLSEYESFRQYRIVISEKLPTDNCSDLLTLSDCLQNNVLMTVHSRLFSPKIYKPDKLREISIKWPNVYQTHMDPIWNTLPNVLDFIYHNEGTFPSISATKLSKEGDVYYFITETGTCSYNVEIYPGMLSDKVKIDNKDIPWPNYIECYHNAFDTLTEEGKNRFFVNYTVKEIRFLNQLLKSTC